MQKMISVLTSLAAVGMLSLGATLILWTAVLMLGNYTEEGALHFIRMGVGWFFVIGVWWML